jgi:hypothetical protein
MHEQRRQRRLVVGLEVAGVPEEHVFMRVRDLQHVDARVPDHRIERADDRPVGILFLLGARAGVIGLDELIGLRRGFTEPAHGPRVVRTDLVVHAGHPVPHVVAGGIGEAQLGPRGDVHRARAALVDPLEVHEEMQLVPDIRPRIAAHCCAAPPACPALLGREVVERRHLLVLVEENAAPCSWFVPCFDTGDDAAWLWPNSASNDW